MSAVGLGVGFDVGVMTDLGGTSSLVAARKLSITTGKLLVSLRSLW